MNQGILDAVIILLAWSVIAVAVFRRLRIPSILAYLIVGVVVGPHGLAWVPHTEDTHFLGELGVVFLLFTVGLEFSGPQLLAMRKVVLGLGIGTGRAGSSDHHDGARSATVESSPTGWVGPEARLIAKS